MTEEQLEAIRRSYGGARWMETVDPDIRVLVALLNSFPGVATTCSCAGSGLVTSIKKGEVSRIPSQHRFGDSQHPPVPYLMLACSSPMSALAIFTASIGLSFDVSVYPSLPPGTLPDQGAGWQTMSMHFVDADGIREFARNLWNIGRRFDLQRGFSVCTHPLGHDKAMARAFGLDRPVAQPQQEVQ